MDKDTVNWRGPMTAIVTPFSEGGSIDEHLFHRVVEQQIRDGVTGIVVGGCTGEFWAMSHAERKHLHRLCVAIVDHRVPVIAGTSAVQTRDAIDLTADAQEAGCDGAMVMPPWFVKLPAADIIAHYKAISDAVSLSADGL